MSDVRKQLQPPVGYPTGKKITEEENNTKKKLQPPGGYPTEENFTEDENSDEQEGEDDTQDRCLGLLLGAAAPYDYAWYNVGAYSYPRYNVRALNLASERPRPAPRPNPPKAPPKRNGRHAARPKPKPKPPCKNDCGCCGPCEVHIYIHSQEPPPGAQATQKPSNASLVDLKDSANIKDIGGDNNKVEGPKINVGGPSRNEPLSQAPRAEATEKAHIDYEGSGNIEHVNGEKADVEGANFQNLTNKAGPGSNINAKKAGNVTNIGGNGAKVKGAQF